MAFLCPSRLGKVKNKRGYYDSMMGRITGSDSIETLVKLELGKQNANNPETRRIILQAFTGYAPEEISVKQGQKVHILFREGDWAYVLTHDKKQGYVPFTYCAKIGKAPSYRAPKLNKDKEKLLSQDAVDINDNDTTLNEFDTTLGEPHDAGDIDVSELVSDSFISDDWSDQSYKETAECDNTGYDDSTENNELETNQVSESVTIILEDDPAPVAGTKPVSTNTDAPNLSSKNMIYTNVANLGQSVAINTTNKPQTENSSNKPTVSVFNTKVPLGRCLVLYDFEGFYEDDASVKQAEIVTVLNMDDSDWYWVRKTDSSEGFVPSNFLFRLGLLVSESRHMVSNTNDNLDTNRHSLTSDELRRSPNLHNSKTPMRDNDKNLKPTYDDREQYIPPVGDNRDGANSSIRQENLQDVLQSSPVIRHDQDAKSFSKVGSASPRYCNFGFEANHNNGVSSPISYSNANSQIDNFYPSENKGTMEVHDVYNDSGTEEIFPPPLEFSNSDENSYNVSQDAYSIEATTGNVHSLEHHQPSHVRNKSQPVSSHTEPFERPDTKDSQALSHHQYRDTEVRYRVDCNGKRVSKGQARPKSTPPGDLTLQSYQYYNYNNQTQYCDSQYSTRVSGHQSERLTPRTNYNYSPTYHSSVWKPYQQPDMVQNVSMFEFSKGHSAFQKPMPSKPSEHAYSVTENHAEVSIPKSNKPQRNSMYETLVYPSGVYNIRSTADSISPKTSVHNAVRKLSDEENQNLFKKLDCIQQSFDGDSQSLQNISKVYERGAASNGNIKQNTESKFNRKENHKLNANGGQRINSSQARQCQNGTDNSENDTVCHHSGISKKQSNTEENKRENNASHSKSLVQSYTSDEGKFQAALNNSGTKSDTQNSTAKYNQKNSQGKVNFTENVKKHKTQDQAHQSNAVTHRKHENTSGQKASHQTVTGNSNGRDNVKQSRNETVITRMTEFISQFDYKATSKSDLPLEKGEVVHVSLEDQNNKHWYWAYSPKLRRHGYVPKNYVEEPQITMI